jgi:hypothetical protein
MASPDGEDTPAKHRGLMPPWKPGQSGNPAGRPKGARSILQEDFFKALQRKFAENGETVLDEMIREKPADFAKMIAGLMSKELTGEDGAPLFPTDIGWNRVKPEN